MGQCFTGVAYFVYGKDNKQVLEDFKDFFAKLPKEYGGHTVYDKDGFEVLEVQIKGYRHWWIATPIARALGFKEWDYEKLDWNELTARYSAHRKVLQEYWVSPDHFMPYDHSRVNFNGDIMVDETLKEDPKSKPLTIDSVAKMTAAVANVNF